MKPAKNSAPVLFVGIDWADKKHDVFWIHSNGKSGYRVIEQSPKAIEELVAQLTEMAGGGPVLLALEKSRGPLQTALVFREEIDLYPIDPKQFCHYRESFISSGAKSDHGDAFLLARMLRERYQDLKPLTPDDETTRRVAQFVQARRQLVDECTRLRLKLQALLKNYFPLPLSFGDVAGGLVLELLGRWPDPRQFRRAHPRALKKLFQGHGKCSDEQLQERIHMVRSTPLLTRESPLIESMVFRVTALIGQLKAVLKQIAAIETALDQAMQDHPDAELFQGCPGAGKAMLHGY